jgi:phosphonate transport system permease protein
MPTASPRAHWKARRTYSWVVVAAIIASIIWSAIGTGADLRVFLHGDAWFQIASFVEGLFPPDLSATFLRSTVWSGVETIALSLMGTVLAVLIALPLGIISGRTVLGGLYTETGMRRPLSARLLRALPYWASTMALNLLRSIPELFWALIFILAVGLGPFAGVLALGFHTGGVLGKLFSEVIEDVNPQPIEALQATGASTAAVLAYGIFPLALPQLVSYTLYRWEVNIRAAAIIGVVGAGGVGRDIYVAISLFHHQQLLTLLLMTLIIVTLVDHLSAWVRALQRV